MGFGSDYERLVRADSVGKRDRSLVDRACGRVRGGWLATFRLHLNRLPPERRSELRAADLFRAFLQQLCLQQRLRPCDDWDLLASRAFRAAEQAAARR